MVLRLPLTTTLGELRQNVCTEKSLDPQGYQLVRPGVPTRPLDLSCTLQEYGASEVTLLSNRTLANNIQNSTADIMSYSLNQENKRGSHVFPPHAGSKGSLTGSSSDGASSRGTSPTRSELPTVFSRPTSKKRPAPPPPLPSSPPPTIPEQEGDTTALPSKGGRREGAGHSRQSSDSSGYHEASVLSDLPDTPSPEAPQGRPNCNLRQPSPSRATGTAAAVHRRSAPVDSGCRAVRPQSTISEAGTLGHGKKRKAPPPPPLALQPSTAALPIVEANMPANTQLAAVSDVPERLVEPSSPVTKEKDDYSKQYGEASTDYQKLVLPHIDASLDSPEEPDSLVVDSSTCVSDSASWEYTIPEPPSPFRTRASIASESKAVSQDEVKTEPPEPDSPKSDLSRDDSGLVDDLGSRDVTPHEAAENRSVSNCATDLDELKSKENDSVSPAITSGSTSVKAELTVHQEAGSRCSIEEKVGNLAKEEQPESGAESSETSSLSAVPTEEPAVQHSNGPDQDQESDESSSVVTKEPMPRRDSLQIYRLKEVKVSARHEDSPSSETQSASESLSEPGTSEVQVEASNSVPEEETFVQTVVVSQEHKGGQVKTTVQMASVEYLHTGSVNVDASKRQCVTSEDSQESSHDAPQTGVLDRRELVKMSSFPNAAEKRTDVENAVWQASNDISPEVKECETSVPEQEAKLNHKQDTERERTPRPRSIVGGPISFSIGSYGSYKTEVVDDIYSGEAPKPNFERFKNIKVISPSTAKSGMHHPVSSKVSSGPTVGSATLARTEEKQSSDGDTVFTVKIGSWETGGDNQALKQSGKQSVSTADLCPSQRIPPVSREAGQLQFEEEKDNLLSEYARLQEQFVAWKQQLASNQNLLEDNKIVPSTAATPAAAPQTSSTAAVNGQHEVRVSTLPRTKPARPLSLVEERSRAFKQPGSTECMTAPVVSFGTWKDQREERAIVSTSSSINRQKSVGGLEGIEERTSKPHGSLTNTVHSAVKQQTKPKPESKKPPGILYAAPVVRGFSPEAIEKLSQEASLQQKVSQSRERATPHKDIPVATSVQRLLSVEPSDKGRVTVTSTHMSSEASVTSQHGSMADRQSLPPYLQSEIVRLAKKPSATSEQHLGGTEHPSCSNNKPSIVQATLKSGVTVEPLASAHSVVKVNGHVGSARAVQDHSTARTERSSGHLKRSTSECDGPRKVIAAQSSSQSATRNSQASVVGTRDILMDEIRNFGGKSSLRKVSTEPAWQLNVCGLRSA
uniref:WH2 domain-containing protein n=1 Tax=Amblyomma sculptum TaxID=1581419 RepID=A0A1E1XPK3_AMBSC